MVQSSEASSWWHLHLPLLFYLQVIKYPPQQESQTNVVGNTPHFDTRFVTLVGSFYLVALASLIHIV